MKNDPKFLQGVKAVLVVVVLSLPWLALTSCRQSITPPSFGPPSEPLPVDHWIKVGRTQLCGLGGTGCVACLKMMRTIRLLKRRVRGEVDALIIDLDREPEAWQTFDVPTMPTWIFFGPDGNEVFRHGGDLTLSQVIDEAKKIGVEVLSAQQVLLERWIRLGRPQLCLIIGEDDWSKEMMEVWSAATSSVEEQADVHVVDTRQDPDVKLDFEVGVTPSVVFFDADGSEVFRSEGILLPLDQLIDQMTTLGIEVSPAGEPATEAGEAGTE